MGDAPAGALPSGEPVTEPRAGGNDAILLYDMDVQDLGTMRVAEHFTVQEGKITRIRQIHDTATLRTAGFAGSPMP